MAPFSLPFTLSPRLRKMLIWSGYPLFAILVAAIALYTSLPRDRIKDKIQSGLSADPMSGAPMAIGADVTVGDLALHLFTGLGLTVSDVVVRSRPIDPNAKPARFVVDDVTVRAGLFGLIFNRPTVKFSAHGLSGEVRGRIDMSPSEQRIDIDAHGLVLAGPSLQQALSLPLEGTVSGSIAAVAPGNLAANLSGKVEIQIDDLVVGDGKAKLTVPGDPFLAAGITFPKLRLGKIAAQVVIEKGRARLENFHLQSADGEAFLDGYLELKDPLSSSQLHGYVRFKPSEALIKREPTVDLINNATAGSAKRPDGFIGFQLSGPLTSIYPLPSVNPPPGVTIKGGAPTVPTSPAATATAPGIVPGSPPGSASPPLPPPPPAPMPTAPPAPPPTTDSPPPPWPPPPPSPSPGDTPTAPSVAPPVGVRPLIRERAAPERGPDEPAEKPPDPNP